MNLIEKLIEQREKKRDEARDLARQKERYIASELLREKQKATMKRIRRVIEQSEKAMTGIRYVIDKKGRKVSVQIDLRKHRQLGECIEHFLISRALRDAAESAPLKTKRRRRALKRLPAKPARG